MAAQHRRSAAAVIEELAGLGQLRALGEPAVFVHGDVRIFIGGDDAVDVPAAGGDDLLAGKG